MEFGEICLRKKRLAREITDMVYKFAHETHVCVDSISVKMEDGKVVMEFTA